MTEIEYVRVSNKAILMGMKSQMTHLMSSDDGKYGVTNEESRAIAEALEKATNTCFKRIGKLKNIVVPNDKGEPR
jgi:hypothetical protein